MTDLPPQNPTEESITEQKEPPGYIFNNCTFNGVTLSGNNIFMDSYGYRTVGDILRLQDQRTRQLAEQQQQSNQQPSLPSHQQPASSSNIPPPQSQPSSQHQLHQPTTTHPFPTPQETPKRKSQPTEEEQESAEEDFINVRTTEKTKRKAKK